MPAPEENSSTLSRTSEKQVLLRHEFAKHESEVRDVYNRVDLWHGTGRKQQRNGQIIDVLDAIVDKNGLVPAVDKFDPTVGVQETTSLTERRMYAQVYSLMNLPEGEELEFQYGTRKQWTREFVHKALPLAVFDIMPYLKRQARGIIEKRRIAPRAMLQKSRQSLHDWRMKVRLQPASKEEMHMATLKSDIPGNYPMLFGMKADHVAAVPISRAIGKHEVRTAQPVPFEDLTHVEVPLQHVAEMESDLAERGVDLKVIPMEFGELESAKYPLSAHVAGNPFKKVV